MTVLPILAVGILMKLVAVLFVLVAVVLVLVILIQKGRGGGLTAAFGGGMAGGLLGSKTGDFLTWVTIVLVAVFLFLAVLMNKFYRPEIGQYGAEPTVTAQQPMAESPTPSPTVGEPAPVAEADVNADANATNP
jgi:preprotein translocase subunit SecG